MAFERTRQTINNIRGVELALSTVITIVLLLIVLIIIAAFFLGGSDTILGPVMKVGESAAGQAEQAQDLSWLR